MKPDYWLHDIRGKTGRNVSWAFARNKGSYSRTVKWKQETVMGGCHEVIAAD